MKKEYIEAGKIVSFHGIKGTVKVQPWADSGAFLCNFDKFFLEKSDTPLEVEKSGVHGNLVLIKFKGYDTPETAEVLRNRILYLKRADCILPEGRYFIEELLGCSVYDYSSGIKYGEILDVITGKANDVWEIKNEEKTFMFPAVDEFIKSVDIDNGKIFVNVIKGIFDDED